MIYLSKFDYSALVSLKNRNLEAYGKVQRFIDNEVIRLMDPYTPFDLGTLKNAPISQTSIGSGRIIQQTPYAKRWYYERANFKGSPRRGNRWFERMKTNHKDSILKGAASICGGRAK